MTKIVRISFDEILIDPEAAGEMLTGCQQRHRKMKFVGACASDDVLIVLFEDAPFRSESRLVLAPLRSVGADDVSAEIQDRYEHGYDLRSSFRIRKQIWALFEVAED